MNHSGSQVALFIKNACREFYDVHDKRFFSDRFYKRCNAADSAAIVIGKNFMPFDDGPSIPFRFESWRHW